jgi:hypothetical protein
MGVFVGRNKSYNLTLAKGDGYMAKRTKRATTRQGRPKRGKATKRTQSATKKKKRVAAKTKRVSAQKPSTKKQVGKGKPRQTAAKKSVARKPKPKPQHQGGLPETVIVDVIEEPMPGVMVVTEFEATRLPDTELAMRDSEYYLADAEFWAELAESMIRPDRKERLLKMAQESRDLAKQLQGRGEGEFL